MPRLPLIVLAALSLGACATTPAPQPAPPPPEPGMERLLGQPPETALQLLGTPSLDKREGPSRQLQFAGSCILDIWYYPQAGHLLATYADARLVDGRQLSPGACFAMLSQRHSRPPAHRR